MAFNTIREWAIELGFCDAALCSAAPFDAEKQRVLSQPELSERRQLRFHPQHDDKRTRSIAVFLWPYNQGKQPEGRHIFVDSYYADSNDDYHAERKLEERIQASGRFAKANVSYPAKEAAVRAGLGIIGDNSLLITQAHGTRVIIILIALGLQAPDVQPQRGGCLHCGCCANNCPSGAIDEKGMSHPERCLRNFMMEGIIAPEDSRQAMGNRLIGCDICQRVCPMQPNGEHESGNARWIIDDFVTGDSSEFSSNVKRLADEIGKNAARPQRIRAQAALLCGNIGNRGDLSVLREWSKSEFAAVREHALWAIQQIESKPV